MKTNRKTKILTVLAIAGLFLFSAALYAAKPAAQSIRQKFVENVKYPDFSIKSGCCVVEMVFTISPEGKIVIKKIESTDEKLKDYVREQVTKICCEDVVTAYNQHFRVKFRFRLL